ncbi:MAG: CHAT domain-containing tetratricopeptide repeat protein [Polyangiaceae bacterium]
MSAEWSWLLAVSDPLGFRVDPSAAAELVPERYAALRDGVKSLAAGNTALAFRQLEGAGQSAARDGDGATASLALSLGWLAELGTYNLFPTGGGAGSMELQLRWDGMERSKAMIQRADEARRLPGARDSREGRAWLQVVTGRLPSLATVRDGAGNPMSDMLVQIQMNQLGGARADAVTVGPSAVAFLERTSAEILAAAGRTSDALEHLNTALQACRAAGDDLGAAGCLSLRADWLVAPRSSALLQNLIIAESPSDTSDLAWMVELVEGAKDGDIAGARAALVEAEALCEGRSARARGAVLLRSAYLDEIEGRVDDQLRRIEDAIGLFQTCGDLAFEHLSRAARAIALLRVSRSPEEREVAKAAGLWGAQDGSLSWALAIGLLFTRAGRQALLREGDYERAERCFELSLALSDALGTKQRAAQTHADLGALFRSVGERDQARAHLEQAIDEIRGDTAAHCGPDALASRKAASAGVSQRAALIAQRLYREALDHRDAEGMHRTAERMRDMLSDSTAAQGAVAAPAVIGALVETLRQADVLVPLYRAVDARSAGQTQESARLFNQALERAEQAAGPQRRILSAVVHATRRDYVRALADYDEYILNKRSQSDLSATLLALMEQMDPNRAAAERAMARRNEAAIGFSFMVRAHAHDRASALLRELESLAGPEWWRDEQPWRNLSDVAEMQEGLGDIDAALRTYGLAIEEIEQRRSLLSRDELKTALSGDQGVQHLYFFGVRAALRCALAAKDEDTQRAALARAFELSEMGRARGLLDLLEGSAREDIASPELPPDIARLRRLSGQSQIWRGLLAEARKGQDPAKVRDLSAKIDECEREIYHLRRTLSDAHPGELPLAEEHAAVASLDEITRLLPAGTALLDMMTLGDHLLVWVITRDGMRAAPVVELRVEVLSQAARRFRDACANGKSLSDRVASKAGELLTERLIAPLSDVLEKQERLIVIPYGDLHLVPFSALRWKDTWVGDRWILSQLPSASVLPRLASRGPSAAPGAALVVGNPSHMSYEPPFGVRSDQTALERSEGEASHIAELYDVSALIGPSATKEKILPLLRGHRVLHFATHGVLCAEAPLLSGILLAEGEVLTVNELMAMRLDADLVTLSACQTALGVRTGGDEVLGLTRGLLASGARRAVVSLWSVLDGSTAVLMRKFYDELRANSLAGPAEALRRAQRWMTGLTQAELEEHIRDVTDAPVVAAEPAHPQHWAAFVLVGY